MAIPLRGSWPQPMPIIIQWLQDKAGIKASAEVPENLRANLPAVIVSPAPGGTTADGFTRGRAVDIDIFAADWTSMDATIRKVETALSLSCRAMETDMATSTPQRSPHFPK